MLVFPLEGLGLCVGSLASPTPHGSPSSPTPRGSHLCSWSHRGADHPRNYNEAGVFKHYPTTPIYKYSQILKLIVRSVTAHSYDDLENVTFIIAGSEVGLLWDFMGYENPSSPLYGRGVYEVVVERFTPRSSRGDSGRRGWSHQPHRRSRGLP